MEDRWFLGLDTSAYTTSVALVDGSGRLIADARQVLSVPAGQRGLRQSDAVFQHVRHLPACFERLPSGWGRRVAAVAASSAPRPVPESYMPVFLCGLGSARQAAAALGVPLLTLSHQENHAWAGFWSARARVPARFLLLHASGGTTELHQGALLEGGRFALQPLAATQDLAAGQMIDRVGVALGLPFPAGPALEGLAREGRKGAVTLPVSVQERTVSFSGPTTAALRMLERGVGRADLARAVLECVADTLIGLVNRAWHRPGGPRPEGLLAVGGVMANRLIRERLNAACGQWGLACSFAEPRFSVDNAVGVAVAAAVAHGQMRHLTAGEDRAGED